MPNFFSAFTSEVFRPIVTLLIPGAIGISSWLVWLLWHFPGLMQLVSANHTESSFVILLAMIFAGLVFEDAGSHWETWLDGRADKVNKDHLRHWHEYLRTCFKSDPIGRRYARTLVLKLKFELGVAFAMASAGVGIVMLGFSGLNCRIILGTGLVCVLFLGWGLYEASQTHALLGRIRTQLLEGVLIAGQD